MMHTARALGPATFPGDSVIVAWDGLRFATRLAEYMFECKRAGAPPIFECLGGSEVAAVFCKAHQVSEPGTPATVCCGYPNTKA